LLVTYFDHILLVTYFDHILLVTYFDHIVLVTVTIFAVNRLKCTEAKKRGSFCNTNENDPSLEITNLFTFLNNNNYE
jgi:hypothetical protein